MHKVILTPACKSKVWNFFLPFHTIKKFRQPRRGHVIGWGIFSPHFGKSLQ
jgi:hypothetical protein